LPPAIGNVSAHAYHARTYSGPSREIVVGVAIANLLSITAGFGSAGDDENIKPDSGLLVLLDVSREAYEQYVAELSLLRDETRQFLQTL
jgi:hypothetical protein